MALSSSASRSTTCMPLPPPPALGLSSTGKPTSRAAAATAASSSPVPSDPGTSGTPAGPTVAFARILSPMASMASGGGPIHVIPASPT